MDGARQLRCLLTSFPDMAKPVGFAFRYDEKEKLSPFYLIVRIENNSLIFAKNGYNEPTCNYNQNL